MTEEEFYKNYNKRFTKGKWDKITFKEEQTQERYMTSGKVVLYMLENNLFDDMPIGMILKYAEYDNNQESEITNLFYNAEHCLRKPESKKDREAPTCEIHVDFETDPISEHIPIGCSIYIENISITPKFIKGTGCAIKLLEVLPDKCRLYFHNLSFDINFLAKHGLHKAVNKRNRFYEAVIKYTPFSEKGKLTTKNLLNDRGKPRFYKLITANDTYALFPDKLENFYKMFGGQEFKQKNAI